MTLEPGGCSNQSRRLPGKTSKIPHWGGGFLEKPIDMSCSLYIYIYIQTYIYIYMCVCVFIILTFGDTCRNHLTGRTRSRINAVMATPLATHASNLLSYRLPKNIGSDPISCLFV